MQPLKEWLNEQSPPPSSQTYRYRWFRTNPPNDELRAALQAFARDAHRDALCRLESILRPKLEPFPGANAAGSPGPIGYPYKLHSDTLQAYFGELLASALVQVIRPFGEDGWEVPAYRWRINVFDLFRALERSRMTGTPVQPVFGAHGDDCSAFRLADGTGRVEAYLICESKCTRTHRSTLIDDAHKHLRSEVTAMDIPQLLEVLADGPAELHARWFRPLYDMYHNHADRVPRYHMVLYVYGHAAKNGKGWLPTAGAHKSYAAPEPLEAVEVHIADLPQLVGDIYAASPPWS